jgi:hypothetical protein
MMIAAALMPAFSSAVRPKQHPGVVRQDVGGGSVVCGASASVLELPVVRLAGAGLAALAPIRSKCDAGCRDNRTTLFVRSRAPSSDRGCAGTALL